MGRIDMSVARVVRLMTVFVICFVSGAPGLRGETRDAPLPTLNIEPGSITISGISSGAYLAHYLHVIHSTTFSGAGLIAGGPYDCPRGAYPLNLYRIFDVCMDFENFIPFGGPPDPALSVELAHNRTEAGEIDGMEHLTDDQVLLVSGANDDLVPTSVVESAASFYAAFMPSDRIRLETLPTSDHAFPTLDLGNACETSESPFINECDYDAAGEILQSLYEDLDAPAAPQGKFRETPLPFDQTRFVPEGRAEHGVADRGFVYMPKACADGASCRLHVALHGCQQTEADIGDKFIRQAGYNRWADANNIVILYPKAQAVTRRFLGFPIPWPNPRGCWDWWGFTGEDYAVKTGAQVAAIKAMIDHLAGRGSSITKAMALP